MLEWKRPLVRKRLRYMTSELTSTDSILEEPRAAEAPADQTEPLRLRAIEQAQAPFQRDRFDPGDADDTEVVANTRAFTDVAAQSTANTTHAAFLPSPTPTPQQPSSSTQVPRSERSLRRELFKLLLSRLNKLNEFNSSVIDPGHENRLSDLLANFWASDRSHLRMMFGSRFNSVTAAFEAWQQMRERLTRFRVETEYRGGPGGDWKKFLQELGAKDQRLRAKAVLAHWELGEVEEGVFEWGERFEQDLMLVFDGLTRYVGCNGAEEFAGLAGYNKELMEWFGPMPYREHAFGEP
jgi:hypothetical protein